MKGRLVFLLSLMCVAQALPLSLDGGDQVQLTRGKRHLSRNVENIRTDIADKEVRTIISAIVDAILDGDRKKRSEIPDDEDDDFEKDDSALSLQDVSDETAHIQDKQYSKFQKEKSVNVESNDYDNNVQKRTLDDLTPKEETSSDEPLNSGSSNEIQSGSGNNKEEPSVDKHQQVSRPNSELPGSGSGNQQVESGSGSHQVESESGSASFLIPELEKEETSSKKSLIMGSEGENNSGSGQTESNDKSKKQNLQIASSTDSSSGSGDSNNDNVESQNKTTSNIKGENENTSGSGEVLADNSENDSSRSDILNTNSESVKTGESDEGSVVSDNSNDNSGSGSAESGESGQVGDLGDLDDGEELSIENAGFIIEPEKTEKIASFDFGRAKRDEDGQDIQDRKEKQILETINENEELAKRNSINKNKTTFNKVKKDNKIVNEKKLTNTTFSKVPGDSKNAFATFESSPMNLTNPIYANAININYISNTFYINPSQNVSNLSNSTRFLKREVNSTQNNTISTDDIDSELESIQNSGSGLDSGSGAENSSNFIIENSEDKMKNVKKDRNNKKDNNVQQLISENYIKRNEIITEENTDSKYSPALIDENILDEISGQESDEESGSTNDNEVNIHLSKPQLKKEKDIKEVKREVNSLDEKIIGSGSGDIWDDSSGYGYGSASGKKREQIHSLKGVKSNGLTSNSIEVSSPEKVTPEKTTNLIEEEKSENSENSLSASGSDSGSGAENDSGSGETTSDSEKEKPTNTNNFSETTNQVIKTSSQASTKNDSAYLTKPSIATDLTGKDTKNDNNEISSGSGSEDESGKESGSGDSAIDNLIDVNESVNENSNDTVDIAKVSNINAPEAINKNASSVSKSLNSVNSKKINNNSDISYNDMFSGSSSGSGSGSGIEESGLDETKKKILKLDLSNSSKQYEVNVSKPNTSNTLTSNLYPVVQSYPSYIPNFPNYPINITVPSNVKYHNSLDQTGTPNVGPVAQTYPNYKQNISINPTNNTVSSNLFYHNSLGRTGKPTDVFSNNNMNTSKPRLKKKKRKTNNDFDMTQLKTGENVNTENKENEKSEAEDDENTEEQVENNESESGINNKDNAKKKLDSKKGKANKELNMNDITENVKKNEKKKKKYEKEKKKKKEQNLEIKNIKNAEGIDIEFQDKSVNISVSQSKDKKKNKASSDKSKDENASESDAKPEEENEAASESDSKTEEEKVSNNNSSSENETTSQNENQTEAKKASEKEKKSENENESDKENTSEEENVSENKNDSNDDNEESTEKLDENAEENEDSKSDQNDNKQLRSQIIEEIVTDMAKAAIQSVEVDESNSVVKKSNVNILGESNSDDNEEDDMIPKKHYKRSHIEKIKKKDKSKEMTGTLKDLVHSILQEDSSLQQGIEHFTKKRKKDEKKLADDLMNFIESSDDKKHRNKKEIMSEIKDFEGFTNALTESSSLSPEQHQLIARKLEKDLLHHLGVAKYSPAIHKDENQLQFQTELEFVRGKIASIQKDAEEYANTHADNIEDVRKHAIASLNPLINSKNVGKSNIDGLSESISRSAWMKMLKHTRKNRDISVKVRRNLDELLNLS